MGEREDPGSIRCQALSRSRSSAVHTPGPAAATPTITTVTGSWTAGTARRRTNKCCASKIRRNDEEKSCRRLTNNSTNNNNRTNNNNNNEYKLNNNKIINSHRRRTNSIIYYSRYSKPFTIASALVAATLALFLVNNVAWADTSIGKAHVAPNYSSSAN